MIRCVRAHEQLSQRRAKKMKLVATTRIVRENTSPVTGEGRLALLLELNSGHLV